MSIALTATALDRYRASLKRVEILDAETERELAQSWTDGNEAAGILLIESSLPFVIAIAREYRRWGVPLEDLVQQGNLGLLKAASKFDPEKKCRLITYAAYWIRAEIRDYVVRSYRIVRLGTTRTERRAMRAFRRKSVESPQALAEESGMPLTRAKQLWPLLARGDLSLDASVTDAPTAMERMSYKQPTPEESVARSEAVHHVRAALDSALQSLTDREQRIVEARILSDEPCTLEALGREMGVSKERVRQLEVRAREKLRERLEHLRPAA
ncbi:MAG: sigma-70 family RNA polymerase sigma factor [Deltaproteobacteria bacterium]|nr:sigma-70 family RNA polymerase sigma factor [Deltaproteobacteria bacterium]